MAFIYFDNKKIEIIEESFKELPEKKSDFSGNSGKINIPNQPSEIADAIDRLNKDELDNITKMTTIDMNARLHPIEISANLDLDLLVSLHVLPAHALSLTRQKKRLSVSMGGE